jgi:hypothetical protein
MKFILILILALSLCSGTSIGAGVGDLDVAALKSILMNDSSGPQSYRFELDTDQMMEIINLSNASRPSQLIHIRSIGIGSLNLTSRSLKLVMASTTLPLKDEENATAIAVEEYMQNNSLFIKVDGNWSDIKLNATDLWTKQDREGQQMELLNMSDISLVGMETVDGQKCYKIRADLKMQDYLKVAGEQVNGIIDGVNLSLLYKDSTTNLTYWFTSDTHQLKKAEVVTELNMTPESLGIHPKAKEEIHITTITTLTFKDYNMPVKIKLPAEARKAKQQTLNMTNATVNLP